MYTSFCENLSKGRWEDAFANIGWTEDANQLAGGGSDVIIFQRKLIENTKCTVDNVDDSTVSITFDRVDRDYLINIGDTTQYAEGAGSDLFSKMADGASYLTYISDALERMKDAVSADAPHEKIKYSVDYDLYADSWAVSRHENGRFRAFIVNYTVK